MSGGMSATTITMLAITAAGTVASMANSAAQADQQAEYASQTAKMQNDQAMLQQASIAAQASQQEVIRRQQLGSILSTQAAMAGAHGLDIGASGSVGALEQGSVKNAESDIAALHTNASTQMLMSKLQASQASYVGSAQAALAGSKATGAMMGGLMNLGKVGIDAYGGIPPSSSPSYEQITNTTQKYVDASGIDY